MILSLSLNKRILLRTVLISKVTSIQNNDTQHINKNETPASSIVIMSVIFCYTERRYAEWRHAGCLVASN